MEMKMSGSAPLTSPPRAEIKLDLASGPKPKPGFMGVDIHVDLANVKKVDLTKFPWPWKDDSVSEIFCSHFIEHLPMVFVEPDGSYSQVPSKDGVDLLIRFFNECWRIMEPGAVMKLMTPSATSARGFQDPTHRRFIVAETFIYLHRKFRVINDLEHYLHAECDFDFDVASIIDNSELLRHKEVQAARARTLWNVVQDWAVTLTKPVSRIPEIPPLSSIPHLANK